MQSPLVSRLKGVHQNGCNYLIDPRQSTSRFEHSMGVMTLVLLLGGSEREQAAALLHDVGHTAFSHVIDLAFGTGAQDYHERVKNQMLHAPDSLAVLQECGLTPDDVETHLFPLTKSPLSRGLSADRFDYCMRDLKAVNQISQPEYAAILNSLQRGTNGLMECKDLDSARLVFTKFLEVNRRVYFDPRAEVAGLTVAVILQQMVQQGLLDMQDLFLDEPELIGRMQQSPFGKVFSSISPQMRFAVSESPTPYIPMVRKLRVVDPQIAGLEGALTDHCSRSRDELERYLETPTVLYYDIEALESC